VWTAGGRGLEVQAGRKVYSGFRALRMIVLLNPITYFAIAVSIAALGDVPGPAALFRRVIVGTCLVLLMPPLAWLADTFFRNEKRPATGLAPTAEPFV